MEQTIAEEPRRVPFKAHLSQYICMTAGANLRHQRTICARYITDRWAEFGGDVCSVTILTVFHSSSSIQHEVKELLPIIMYTLGQPLIRQHDHVRPAEHDQGHLPTILSD